MIYESMNCLSEEINEHFRQKFNVQDDRAVLSAIVNQDGSIAIIGENKIVITLLNIMREIGVQNGTSSVSQKTVASSASPLCFSLSILISAYFSGSNYSEALRFLSYTMTFLHEKNVFNRVNTPRLPNNITTLIFEMDGVPNDRLNNVWATLGAKYMPSIIYKVRMLVYDSSMVKEYQPVVSGLANKVN